MCIRDRDWDDAGGEEEDHAGLEIRLSVPVLGGGGALAGDCLLYTSDAADERSSVDLGGRRIIKKKNTQ